MAKYNIASDKTIQGQTDTLTSQKILKQINDLCDNLARQFNNAMEYQKAPLRVVPAEDVDKAVYVVTEFPDRYQQTIDKISADLADYNGKVNEIKKTLASMDNSYYSVSASLRRVTQENVILKESNLSLQKALKTFKLRKWAKTVIISLVAAAFIASALAVGYFGFWSEDALASKAYRIALALEEKHPEQRYLEIRNEFETNGYLAAKDLVKKYQQQLDEKLLQEQNEEEAKK